MSRPHVTEHERAMHAFKNRIALGAGVCSAIRASVAAGARVDRDWVRKHHCPTLDEIAVLEARGHLISAQTVRTEKRVHFQDETRALELCDSFLEWAKTTSADDDAKRAAEAREAERMKRREVFVRERAQLLRQQHEDDLMRGFVERATAEFDDAHPPIVFEPTATPTPEPAPEPPTPIRSARRPNKPSAA